MRFKLTKNTLDASTREEILNVAQSVFSENGFKEATVRQICKAAKANVCLISYYFGGKDGLYVAVFERMAKIRLEHIKTVLGDTTSISSREEYRLRLQLFLEGMYREISSKPEFFKLIQREIIDGMPRASAVIKNYIGTAHMMFLNFLELGQKQKYLKRDLNPRMTMLSIMNMITGAVSQQYNDADFFFKDIDQKDIPEIVIKTVSQIFFEGVLQ
jgi:AcrR family transcriptional regulator